jgi:hypothetical protein
MLCKFAHQLARLRQQQSDAAAPDRIQPPFKSKDLHSLPRPITTLDPHLKGDSHARASHGVTIGWSPILGGVISA